MVASPPHFPSSSLATPSPAALTAPPGLMAMKGDEAGHKGGRPVNNSRGTLCCAVVCCGMLWCAVVCCAVLCCAVLCCAVVGCDVMHFGVL